MKKTITEAEYLAELERCGDSKPPAGSFTCYDAADRGKISRKAAEMRLKADRRLASGKFKDESGHYCRYYWIKR